MKRYIKDNKEVFSLINKNYKIIEIKPIKKNIKKGVFYETFISSYCVIYEKMI